MIKVSLNHFLLYTWVPSMIKVLLNHFLLYTWVPRGSVVKCLTRDPGVLGSSRTGSSGFFPGNDLGQDTSEPSLVLAKPRKDMNKVSCRRDTTKILLKVAYNTIQSINLLYTDDKSFTK